MLSVLGRMANSQICSQSWPVGKKMDQGRRGKTAEVGITFFQKGIATLLSFLGHVKQGGGITRQFLNPGQAVGIGIEG